MKPTQNFPRPLWLCTLFCIVSSLPCLSQNLIGFTSNYAGAVSTYLNPSSITQSKIKLDINLITIGAHLQNNYFAIPKSQYKTLDPFHNGFADISAYQANTKNSGHYSLYTKEQIHLPSLMYSTGKWAVGFHFSFRAEAHVKNAPADIVQFLTKKTLSEETNSETETRQSGKFSFAAGVWEELGVTYARTLIRNERHYLSAGVTGNLLLGNAAWFAKSKNLEYHFNDTSSISFSQADINFGGVNPQGLTNGFGIGLDLGVTWCIGALNQNSDVNTAYYFYKYKFGAALLDVGGIRFSKAMRYNIDSYNGESSGNASGFEEIENIGDELGGTSSDSHFNFYLPTALSLQFDYNINESFFIGTNYIQSLRFTASQVRRPSVLSLTPRFERKWFEVSLPFSLYDWRTTRMGLEMRIFFLVIGTEKLGSFFNMKDFSGLDAYISLHFFIGKKIGKGSVPMY